MNHTPGPWEVGTERIDNTIQRCYVYFTHTTPEMNKANARLIAAAPELLEALERIHEETQDSLMANIAYEAIRKARGDE